MEGYPGSPSESCHEQSELGLEDFGTLEAGANFARDCCCYPGNAEGSRRGSWQYGPRAAGKGSSDSLVALGNIGRPDSCFRRRRQTLLLPERLQEAVPERG